MSSITSRRFEKALEEFHSRCPGVIIELDIGGWEEVLRRLSRQQADLGVAPARFFQAEFRYDLLDEEPIGLYCGRTHALFGTAPRRPDLLSNEALIMTGGDEPDVIARFRLKYGLGRNIAGRAEQLDEAKRLTRLGVGLCFLPEAFAQEDEKSGELWPLLHTENRFTSEIYLISPPQEQMQLPAKLFRDGLISS